MPQFTYQGSGERVYPDIQVSGAVLVAQAGKSYDLDAAPDELWVSVSATQTPLEAVSEPVTPVTDTTESTVA